MCADKPTVDHWVSVKVEWVVYCSKNIQAGSINGGGFLFLLLTALRKVQREGPGLH